MKTEILEGTFKVNEWIPSDFKGLPFQRANKGRSKRKFWVMLNPYVPITKCGVLVKSLKAGQKLKDEEGAILKVVKLGSAALFGPDQFSFQWVAFYCVNCKF